MVSFFSAASCKIDTLFGAARKIFGPPYFVMALASDNTAILLVVLLCHGLWVQGTLKLFLSILIKKLATLHSSIFSTKNMLTYTVN